MRMRSWTRQSQCVWKGLIAGAAGGLVASWVMNQFQTVLSKLGEGSGKPHGAQALKQGIPQQQQGGQMAQSAGRKAQTGQSQGDQSNGDQDNRDQDDEDATERAAKAVVNTVLHRPLSKREKETGGAVMHYAMGVTSGSLYGAAAELAPQVRVGAGAPFGAAVWLVADEAVVPALGLSKWPQEYPLSTHAKALASHLVYGLTTEAVRRAVRQAW
jgi:putative membrane protein